jgi:hypothetical protein
MTHDWNIKHRTNDIRCQRDSRTVFIPLENGRPKLNWQSGFGALSGKGEITWMNPEHVRAILKASGVEA